MAPKTCCKCFGLLTGSKIIAIIYTVGSALALKGFTVIFTNLDKTISVLLGFPANKSLHFHDVNNGTNLMVLKRGTYGIDKIMIFLITLYVVYLLSCLVLMVGIFKRVPRLITPWIYIDLIRQLIFLAFSSYAVWITFTLFVSINLKTNSPLIAIPISVGISSIIIMGLSLYFWMIVKTSWVEHCGKKNNITKIVPTVGTVVISVINTDGVDDEKEIKKSPDAATLKPIARAFNRLKIVNKLK